jgi:hypothetical protein
MYFPIELSINLKLIDLIVKNKKNFIRSKIKKLSKSNIQHRKRSKFNEHKGAILM